MGIGGFLASQSERDHYRYLFSQTAGRVKRSCSGEMEREVSEVLAPIGVDEKTCRAVAKCLREVEVDQGNMASSSDVESASLRWSKEVGLTPFLLKFGQGLGKLPSSPLALLLMCFPEEVPNRRMYTSAFTIGMGYLLGGLIPLLPYFFIPRAQLALIYSCIVTGLVLLVFGAVKARVTGAGVTAGSYVWGAVSTLMVGGIAAASAFAIVRVLEN
jgi:vacuolar iron transporter family protein